MRSAIAGAGGGSAPLRFRLIIQPLQFAASILQLLRSGVDRGAALRGVQLALGLLKSALSRLALPFQTFAIHARKHSTPLSRRRRQARASRPMGTLDAFLTRDEGFVVELSGGDQVQITVIANCRGTLSWSENWLPSELHARS